VVVCREDVDWDVWRRRDAQYITGCDSPVTGSGTSRTHLEESHSTSLVQCQLHIAVLTVGFHYLTHYIHIAAHISLIVQGWKVTSK
jgi:hypothetical protein